MKPLLIFTVYGLLVGVLINISCKKEYSCEGCSGNKPPVANAGPDQVITLPTDSVFLDGSSSSDPDGMISSYLWTKISGPAFFTINNSSTATTVVKNLVSGIYQFELKVTDNGRLSANDTVQITVNDPAQPNRPPVARAGADQTITLPVNTVILDGRGSTDPDNNITGYVWTKIAGPPSFNITNSTAIQTPTNNLVNGIYKFELRVWDSGGLFSKDTTEITVNPLTLPPSACAPITRPLINAQLVPLVTLSQNPSTIAAAGNKIVFAGGWPGNPPLTVRADIFDIVTANLTTVPLSQSRFYMGSAVLGNRIYLAGGLIPIELSPGSWGFNGAASTAVDIYDVSANTWTTDQLSNPQAPKGATANNKVVFAGGEYYWPSQVANIFNATSNSWSTATLSSPRRVLAATTIGDKIFFAGGDYGDDGFTSNIDIYDATSNSWTVSTFSPPFDQGWAPTGIAIGNINYWAGGWYYSPAIYVAPTDHVEIRNENTHTSTFACLFQPNYGFSAAVKNNKIVFFTGGGLIKNKFDIYDIATNTWSIGVLSQDIEGASIISVNNIIYVAGGKVNGVLSNQLWKLEF